MTTSIIVAVAENGVIGRDNALPWRLSADMKRFKVLTMGHHLVVGRKTWESIGRPLPGRKMIVVSRRGLEAPPEVAVARSIDEAIALAAPGEEVFIAGGAEIYRESVGRADRLYLTRVHAAPSGDAFFPELDLSQWRTVSSERHEADEKNDSPYDFVVLEKR
jgi:dihydrofolate reductase